MIFSRVRLAQHPADARSIIPEYHEEVVHLKPHRRQFVDEFHVRKPLPVRADFVLALHDEYAAGFQNAERFS